jgi:hypothetical protein
MDRVPKKTPRLFLGLVFTNDIYMEHVLSEKNLILQNIMIHAMEIFFTCIHNCTPIF